VLIRVDAGSLLPPYEQIRKQMATMIMTGVLSDGARLPAIRQLAKDLGLAGGTVGRAYRELESSGLIVTRGRHGTYVTAPSEPVQRREAETLLADAAHAYAVSARQLGADPERAIEIARRALDAVGRT
jgi:DNA-binding transcriptional regulator YhcF (GntR family)